MWGPLRSKLPGYLSFDRILAHSAWLSASLPGSRTWASRPRRTSWSFKIASRGRTRFRSSTTRPDRSPSFGTLSTFPWFHSNARIVSLFDLSPPPPGPTWIWTTTMSNWRSCAASIFRHRTTAFTRTSATSFLIRRMRHRPARRARRRTREIQVRDPFIFEAWFVKNYVKMLECVPNAWFSCFPQNIIRRLFWRWIAGLVLRRGFSRETPWRSRLGPKGSV